MLSLFTWGKKKKIPTSQHTQKSIPHKDLNGEKTNTTFKTGRRKWGSDIMISSHKKP